MDTVTRAPSLEPVADDGTRTPKAPGVQRTILAALNRATGHVYAGTAPEAEVARRRAANKRAARTRRVARRRSA